MRYLRFSSCKPFPCNRLVQLAATDSRGTRVGNALRRWNSINRNIFSTNPSGIQFAIAIVLFPTANSREF